AGRAAQGPGVAYLAHVVGFALGFAFAWVRFGGRTRACPAGQVAGE
ncbi:rhomboid family intramembrane serine protease, partial [Streptomyces anandii]